MPFIGRIRFWLLGLRFLSFGHGSSSRHNARQSSRNLHRSAKEKRVLSNSINTGCQSMRENLDREAQPRSISTDGIALIQRRKGASCAPVPELTRGVDIKLNFSDRLRVKLPPLRFSFTGHCCPGPAWRSRRAIIFRSAASLTRPDHQDSVRWTLRLSLFAKPSRMSPLGSNVVRPYGRAAQSTGDGQTFPQAKHGAVRSMASGNTSAMQE